MFVWSDVRSWMGELIKRGMNGGGENKICSTGGRLIVYRTSGGSWLHYCIKDFNIYCVKNIVFVIPSVNTQIKFLNLALFLFHLCLHKLPFSGSKDCHLWNGRKGKGSEGTGHMTKSPCISTFSFQPWARCAYHILPHSLPCVSHIKFTHCV